MTKLTCLDSVVKELESRRERLKKISIRSVDRPDLPDRIEELRWALSLAKAYQIREKGEIREKVENSKGSTSET